MISTSMISTVLYLVVVGGAFIAMTVIAAFALRDTPAPPSPVRPTARRARLVCPGGGNLRRVVLDTAADGTPGVLRCDRFGHREVDCDRACLAALA